MRVLGVTIAVVLQQLQSRVVHLCLVSVSPCPAVRYGQLIQAAGHADDLGDVLVARTLQLRQRQQLLTHLHPLCVDAAG